jgi:hypothetical protein
VEALVKHVTSEEALIKHVTSEATAKPHYGAEWDKRHCSGIIKKSKKFSQMQEARLGRQ